MLQNNYLRIATCVPKVHLGNPMKNVEEITKMISQIKDASIILFPELAITGYSIGDWMTNNELLEQANLALDTLVQSSNQQIIIVGGPLQYNNKLYNVAYVIQNKTIIGAVPKMHLPSYREFFERRIFESGSEFYKQFVVVKQGNYEFPFGELLFDSEFVKFGIEICEDLWQNNAPHIDLYDNGAHIVFNLSTSTFQINKSERRRMICDNASFLGSGAYVYTSTGISETSSDILYSGHMIVCECGEVLVDDESLSKEENFHLVDIDLEMINYNRRVLNTTNHTDFNHLSKVSFNLRPELEVLLPIKREISSFPFSLKTNKNKQDVIDVVSTALYHRLKHIGIKKVVLGVSGGLDSTLALLMINYCFEKYNLDKSGIIAITMPGLGTGQKSKNNAYNLCQGLNINLREIAIGEEVKHHFQLIGKDDENKDITYENIQARYRTLILMNVANKENAIVCGTGDMSEIALGWSTFNGDQMSMYNLNGGLPKTTIRELTDYFITIYPSLKDALEKVINLPISPELTSSQQLTEDIIGKYEINDFIMYHIFIRGASKNRIKYLLMQVFGLSIDKALSYYDNFMKRFCRNQFKRLTGPESIKIFSFSFSARSDLHFPGDMKY